MYIARWDNKFNLLIEAIAQITNVIIDLTII